MSWLTILAIAEIVWVTGTCVWIVLERRSPQATLAWIFALAWMPYIGIAVYLLIGPRRLHRKRRRHALARNRVKETPWPAQESPSAASSLEALAPGLRQVMAMVQHANEGPPLRAQRLELLPSGDCCYDAMAEAIAAARHHVHLEYYIWHDDVVGRRFRDLLCVKAAEDVHVRLLLDAIGSSRVGRRFLAPLREAGVHVAWFNPLSLAKFRPGLLNFRTHRKIVVCDGRVGFTGGINVCGDHSVQARGRRAWRDTQLRLEGPPVGWLQRLFFEDWAFATGTTPNNPVYFPQEPEQEGGPWVQVLGSGPDDDLHAIHKFFFAAITAARRRVWLSTAYFVPDEPIMAALITAALRGVDVRIMLPLRSDHWLVDAAARSYFEDLSRAGVQLFLYGPTMLHTKTLVVDDDLAVVGTANMDNRSFRLNFEVVAAVYDAALVTELAGQFEADLLHTKPCPSRHGRRRPFAQAFKESAARLLAPLL